MEALVNATSGGVAAVCSTLIVYPLDTLLVRCQAASTRKSANALRSETTNSLVVVLADSMRERGGFFPSLYKGVGFKVTEALSRNFIYFYWYQVLKKQWRTRMGDMNTTANLIVATLAAVLNQCVTAPMEVISTQLQTSNLSTRKAIQQILNNDGLLGFYRGFGAALILCSNPAITNATFDQLKAALQVLLIDRVEQEEGDDDEFILPQLSSFQSFVLGALAKALATILTYPYIRSKVLVQARGGRSSRKPTHSNTSPEPLQPLPHQQQPLPLKPYASFDHLRGEWRGLGNAREMSTSSLVSRSGYSLMNDHNSICSRETNGRSGVLPSMPSHRDASGEEFLKAASFCVSEFGGVDNPAFTATYGGGQGGVNMQLAASTSSLLGYHTSHGGENSVGWRRHPTPQPMDLHRRVEVDKGSSCGRPKYPTGGGGARRSNSEFSIAESDRGVVEVLVSTVMNEGVPGLYRGLTLQLLKTVLNAAILYMIKERIESVVRKIFRLVVLLVRSRVARRRANTS